MTALLLAFVWPALALVGSTPTIRQQQWHLDFLHIDEAQHVSTGAGVVVAIVDTGVDSAHPDLAGSVLPETDLASPPPGSGSHGDDNGHGTQMAGIVAAHGQATGIAPSAKILPIRVTDGVQDPNSMSTGIDWAVDHGAKVINISVAAAGERPDDRTAIARAISKDVVVVAAAGNNHGLTRIQFPAAYPGVVAVTGVDRQGNHAAVSLTGPEAVLAAPAVDVVTTDPTGYVAGTGTSAAAAIVSGVVALIRSKFPAMSAAEVVHRLEATADDKGPPGRDDVYGYGIVDPVRALTADVPPLTPTPTATAVAGGGDGGSSIDWTRTVLLGVGILLVAGLATNAVLAYRRRT
jgi:type VII secretion-associated serine protease mycosin